MTITDTSNKQSSRAAPQKLPVPQSAKGLEQLGNIALTVAMSADRDAQKSWHVPRRTQASVPLLQLQKMVAPAILHTEPVLHSESLMHVVLSTTATQGRGGGRRAAAYAQPHSASAGMSLGAA